MGQAEQSFVHVRVTARQVVRYDQILAFTLDDWATFKQMDEAEAAIEVMDRLDLHDVDSGEDIDPDDFNAVAVDTDGNRLVPRDGYGEADA